MRYIVAMTTLKLYDTNLYLPKHKIAGIDGAMRNNGLCMWGPCGLKTGVLKVTLEGTAKLEEAENSFGDFLEKEKPDLAAIEGYSYGSKFGRSFDMAEVGGVFRLMLHKRNIPTIEVPPNVLKKYITGNGKAAKPLIKKCIKKLFDIDIKNSDEADAFVLALICHDFFLDETQSKLKQFSSYVRQSCRQIVAGSTVSDYRVAANEMKDMGLTYVKEYVQLEQNLNELEQIHSQLLKANG